MNQTPLRCHFARCLTALAAFCIVAWPARLAAQSTADILAQRKAAYLFNFAKYTEWPKDAFADDNAPFVLGILGSGKDDPFGKAIDAVKNKKVRGHDIEVKYFADVKQTTNCHLLFICASKTNQLAEILKALENTSVLTVAEADGFLQKSGMINLWVEKSSASALLLNFEINPAAAGRANLKLNTELIRLAKARS